MSAPVIYIKTPLSSLIQIRKVISVLLYEKPRTYDTDRFEKHPFWEMVYVLEGSLFACGGENTYHLHAGDVVFHKPNELHRLYGDEKNSARFFILSFDCSSTAMAFFRGFCSSLTLEQKSLMNKLIWEGRRTFVHQSIPGIVSLTRAPEAPLGGEQMVKNLLELILIMITREKSESGEALFLEGATFENKIAEEIILFLRQNVYGRISLDEVCSHLKYGKTFLCTLFKKQTGRTILQHYTILKITEAKRLIRETDQTFAEIAALLSFDTPYYFSQTFRRITGLSPREFRASLHPDASALPKKI